MVQRKRNIEYWSNSVYNGINNNLQMYNSYTANRSLQQQKQHQGMQQQFDRWRTKYTYLQPRLVQNYHRRVTNFIQKMEQDPVTVHEEDNWKFLQPFRNVHQKDKFIDQKTFKFRDLVDWQSILTPIDRIQRTQLDQKSVKYLNETGLPKSLVHRDLASQEPYQAIKDVKFRDREKEGEIHVSPMRFNYVPKNDQRRSQVFKSRKQSAKKKLSTFSECSRHEKSLNKSMNLSEDISIRLTKNFSVKEKHQKQKIIPARISRVMTNETVKDQMRELQFRTGNARKEKLHFKAVIETSNSNSELNKTAKNVLQNCSILRYRNKQPNYNSNSYKS